MLVVLCALCAWQLKIARAAAKAAAGPEADGQSTRSFVPSTDSDAGSGSTADSSEL